MFALLFLAALPSCDGTILEAFERDAIQAPKKGSDQYIMPDDQTRVVVGEALRSVFEQQSKKRPDYVFALQRAALAGYELCAEEERLLFRPVKAGFGQPVISIRLGKARGVIVEVPHTVFDYRTLEQGAALYFKLNARALIVAGAHRCASGKPSACDGASNVCGEGGPFRASDMAHATETVFQLAHETIAAAYRDDLVVSLHGMDGGGAVLSDGTTIETSSTAVVARLAKELGGLLPAEPVLVCNGASGRRPAVEKKEVRERRIDDLCGTTNVQGRALNGVEDACKQSATRSSGRFLHLEQSLRLRKQPEILIEALERVLPPTP